MLGTTHRIIGASCGAGVALAMGRNWRDALLLTTVAACGALIPDIDCPGSRVARYLLKLSPAVALACFFYAAGIEPLRTRIVVSLLAGTALAMLPYVLKLVLGHRGATHSLALWLPLLIGSVVLPVSLPATVLAGLFIGIVGGGILPDALTHSGVTFFWPFTERRYRLVPSFLCCTTGGLFELTVVRPLSWLALILCGIKWFFPELI